MVTFDQTFVFSHCNFCHLFDQIKSNSMYWLHWHAYFVFACSNQNINLLILFEMSELNELEYLKTPSQISSSAHWHAFLYLHAYIKTLFYLSYLKSEKKSKLNGLNKLEYLKKALTDEQLCLLTCFFLFTCSNKYENIYLFVIFEIRKNRLR